MVIVDNDDIVVFVALIPGNNPEIPAGGHLYFPLTETLPIVGQKFVPNFKEQPWLI